MTHAAGLSSTGDAKLDAALPMPERFEVPGATVAAVERARSERGRVIAVGTSHYALLRAFAPGDLLARASAHAEQSGYLSHEFGDSWLIL